MRMSSIIFYLQSQIFVANTLDIVKFQCLRHLQLGIRRPLLDQETPQPQSRNKQVAFNFAYNQLIIMECNFKKRKSKKSSRSLVAQSLNFRVKRIVPFGKAVFVCGNIAELGNWHPASSFRLNWSQTNCWVGTVELRRTLEHPIQFKFITSDWEIVENSIIEWQLGKINRKIQISSLRYHSVYNADWNKQQIILCLHGPQDPDKFSRYYVSGNIEPLGNWKQHKELNPISKELKDTLNMYFKTDPEFSCQLNLSTFYTYTFSVNLDANKINYTYLKKGDISERENFIGRFIAMDAQSKPRGRIKEIDWIGSKYIIDQPQFEQLFIEKLTNQLYLATNLKNSTHFDKIVDKHITTIFSINSIEQDNSITNYYLSSLCRQNNIELKLWTVEDLSNNKFVNEAREIILNLENLLINGHRVCLHCSKKLIKSAPIKLLYLTLLDGQPFCEAIETIKNEVTITETHCKIAEDVFFIVNNKIFRGKTQIKSH